MTERGEGGAAGERGLAAAGAGALDTAKRRLRDQAAGAVARLKRDERTRHDSAICEYLCSTDAYKSAEQVFLYVALDDEVATGPLMERAAVDGKTLLLPVTDLADWTLRFVSWRPGEPLERGEAGVLEPVAGESPTERQALSVIPGRAFDLDGYRLGRGRGCYDRCLSYLGSLGPTMGVAYGCQLFAEVPRGGHDRPVEALATESGLIVVGMGRS